VVERELRMTAHAKLVIYEQSIERTFSWLIRNRRLSKDYERRAQTSEALVDVAAIRLLLRRLARRA
jgi:transposase